MKYVHLTRRENIARIRKNGLRTGDGALGRGVYLTPLMYLPYYTRDRNTEIVSVPISTYREWWSWARRRSEYRGVKPHQVAAIVVDLPERFYPVYTAMVASKIELSRRIVTLVENACSGISMQDTEDLIYVKKYLTDPLGCWQFHLEVCNTRSMGLLLNALKEEEEVQWGCDLQVLVLKSLPSECVQKILPFYRTNKVFRKTKLEG